MNREADGPSQRADGGARQRYFLASALRRERDRRQRRVRIHRSGAHRAAASALAGFSRAQPPICVQPPGLAQTKLALPQPTFIPLAGQAAEPQAHQLGGSEASRLAVGGEPDGADAVKGEVGETAEEAVLRRTRDFNVALRERPQDLQLWLDFAAFQDEAAGSAPGFRAPGTGCALPGDLGLFLVSSPYMDL